MKKNTLRARTTVVALLFGPAGAFAADHQICYQEPPPLGVNATVGRFDCRTDGTSPAGCHLTGLQPNVSIAPNGLANPWGADVTLPGPGTYTATFQFADNTVRTCTLEIGNLNTLAPNQGSQNRQALGYTTDVSGLVTTGVWAATSLPADPAFQEVVVPPDFVAVGGGARGAEGPNGFMVTSSLHDNGNLGPAGPQLWTAGAHSNVPPQTSAVTTYAIGLKIQGISKATLQQIVAFPLTQSTPPGVPHPTMNLMTAATFPQGNVAIAGGVQAMQASSPHGQYITTTQPLVTQQCYANNTCEQLVSGWSVASKDHINPSPWWIIVQMTTLPKVLTIAGNTFHIETWVLSANSAVLAHPSVAVGLPPDFALTGVGAFVNWQTSPSAAGNLLWDLTPRPDIDGAEAGSKDQSYSSPASISAFAIGMKLVPGPVPALAPPNVHKLPLPLPVGPPRTK